MAIGLFGGPSGGCALGGELPVGLSYALDALAPLVPVLRVAVLTGISGMSDGCCASPGTGSIGRVQRPDEILSTESTYSRFSAESGSILPDDEQLIVSDDVGVETVSQIASEAGGAQVLQPVVDFVSVDMVGVQGAVLPPKRFQALPAWVLPGAEEVVENDAVLKRHTTAVGDWMPGRHDGYISSAVLHRSTLAQGCQ